MSAINDADRAIAGWMAKYGIALLRYSLAIVFIWFGILKPLGLSPAEDLVKSTIFWIEDKDLVYNILGWWEVAIGICFLFRPLLRLGVLLLLLQMPGTFMPLVILPDVCFKIIPYAPTTEGQYIIKNLVLISAGLVVGSTIRNTLFRVREKKV